jgi:hypothetical protein
MKAANVVAITHVSVLMPASTTARIELEQPVHPALVFAAVLDLDRSLHGRSSQRPTSFIARS